MGAENALEVVKVVGGKVVDDEFYELRSCPACGGDAARGWGHCPACGEELPDGEPYAPRTCYNVGNSTVFECSECGRKYVPVQIREKSESGLVEWNCCPGCMAVVV